MAEASVPSKVWWKSKRFYSGVATLVFTAATIFSFLDHAVLWVKLVGIGLSGLAAALNQWLGYTSPGVVTLRK